MVTHFFGHASVNNTLYKISFVRKHCQYTGMVGGNKSFYGVFKIITINRSGGYL